MKLRLSDKDGIQVLEVIGPITVETFRVLKAGITKLFRSGKNKMILSFAQCEEIETAVIRDLSDLNLSARELAGEIVLGAVKPDLKTKIDISAKPPGVIAFPTMEEAFAFITKKKKEKIEDAGETPAPLIPPVPPLSGASAPAGVPTEEVEQLKAKIKELEAGELHLLRTENKVLKDENDAFKALINNTLIQRREPPDAESYRSRIKELETQLEQAVDKQ